jgi:hypothetical protein
MLSQAQVPLKQVLPPVQASPQPPQLPVSNCGLMQRPPQQMAPEGQVTPAQEPAESGPPSGAEASAPPSGPVLQPPGVQVPLAQSTGIEGRQKPAPSQVRDGENTDPAQVAGPQVVPAP